MQRIGHGVRRLIAADASWAVFGAVAAALPAWWMWGFTVDDALIPVRYARHIAAGLGWRFNAEGPATDGVTPLAWPLVLALFARAPPLVVLTRAKALGLVAWTCSGMALGIAVGRARAAPAWGRAATLSTLALSVPLAAHSVSGMETSLATGFATGAGLLARRPRTAAVLAGAAASLRPEMAVWACVLAAGLSIAAGTTVRRGVATCGLALAPFAACALARAIVWGHAAPLALSAKPSDLDHGIAYVGAACVVTLVPILAIAPFALRRSPFAAAIVVASAAHAAAVAIVGGDWMPYARLMVPVLPALAYAGALAAEHADRWATAARSIAGLVLGAWLIVRGGTEGRRVGADRASLIAAARPLIADAERVAVLDIGWVSAAADVPIVDLAGLTDPQIAALPGGHTSKRVDAMFLLGRHPDALLLYAALGLPNDDLRRWREARYVRVVEARLAQDAVVARHFAPSAWLRLGQRGAGYVLLRARPPSDQ